MSICVRCCVLQGNIHPFKVGYNHAPASPYNANAIASIANVSHHKTIVIAHNGIAIHHNDIATRHKTIVIAHNGIATYHNGIVTPHNGIAVA